MDKVVYSLKYKTLGYDADYDFLLQMVHSKIFVVTRVILWIDNESKAIILQDFRSKRKKRIEEEYNLKIAFSEDILWSRSELIKLTQEEEIIWRTNKNLRSYKH
jgi:hypothetical protein